MLGDTEDFGIYVQKKGNGFYEKFFTTSKKFNDFSKLLKSLDFLLVVKNF